MAVRWQWLLGGASILCLLLYLCRRGRHADKVLWRAHEHEEAQIREQFAWRDCTGRAPSGAELKRAYRRLARQAHPDRQGSNERFQALDAAHRQLQSSVQFNLRAVLLSGGEVNHTSHGVRDVRLSLHEAEGGTRVKMELDFTSPPGRGLWKFGLLAKDVSSIEYSGADGGYDMCCKFLKDTQCTFKPYSELVAQHQAHTDGAWDASYVQHDCPLKADHVYTGVVDKPLHVSADGLWAAVVELSDEAGKEFACAAATFRVLGGELRPLDEGTKLQL